MTSVLPITVFVVCVVCRAVFSLPCLTVKSKQDFNKARNALKNLENFLKSQASSINSKVQALDKDMTSIEEDFKRKRQWIKYNNHCYYIGGDSVIWTEAERKCREIGGYLVKIDDSSENSWIKQEITKSKKTHFWLGSTDVVNGDWRWIYDQTQLSYKNFVSGRPYPTSNSYSYTFNCLTMFYSNGHWYELPCNSKYPYACESNFCKFYTTVCN
ncbi:CD206 [Mytilus edulis]|uniref:MRC n=1 Tax=Mytilus edulis TaxID=6550 RepID=A0A8S3V7L5_MYTED|nr:CD206 [Mytilus edulis]